MSALRVPEGLKERYRQLIKPLRRMWTVLLVVLVLAYLARNWSRVAELSSDLGVAASAAIVAAVVAAKVVYSEQARLAYHLVDGPHLGFGPFYRVYTISDMAKYVPGGVWGVAARVNSYLRFGLSGKEAARGFSFEKGSLVAGAMFGGLACVVVGMPGGLRGLFDADSTATVPWRGFELLVVMAAWATSTWIAGRLLLRDRFEPLHVLRVIAEHSAIGVLLGIGVWIPTAAVGADLNPWLAIGAFNVGRSVGLVAVFAPAGVGVREAVGLWVLRGQDLDDIALFAFGASRLMTTIAEAATFAVVGVLVRSGRLRLPYTINESPSEGPD